LSQSNSTFSRPICSYKASFSESWSALLSAAPIHEQFRQLLQRRLAPLADLHRMHVILGRQLAQRSLAADRFHCYLGLELRTVLFTRRRHRSSCVHDSAEF
jgi:hypothetical protein